MLTSNEVLSTQAFLFVHLEQTGATGTLYNINKVNNKIGKMILNSKRQQNNVNNCDAMLNSTYLYLQQNSDMIKSVDNSIIQMCLILQRLS